MTNVLPSYAPLMRPCPCGGRRAKAWCEYHCVFCGKQPLAVGHGFTVPVGPNVAHRECAQQLAACLGWKFYPEPSLQRRPPKRIKMLLALAMGLSAGLSIAPAPKSGYGSGKGDE